MTTRVFHEKIPHNRRVPRDKGKAVRDAVTPSVRGIRSVTPSVRGIADRARGIATGLNVLLTVRKLAAATGDTELAALAGNPKVMAAVAKGIKNLQQEVETILTNQAANPGGNNGGDLFENRPDGGDPEVAAGLIGDSRSAWHAMDHDTSLQMEQAAKKAAQLRSTMVLDTEQNKVRAQFGRDPVPLKGDDLYKLFGKEGKRSGA